MTTITTHHLMLLTITQPTFHHKHNTYNPKHSNISFPFLPSIQLSKTAPKRLLLHSGISSNKVSHQPILTQIFSPETVLLFVYFLVFLSFRILSTLLPPDFAQRWHNLIVFSEKAENEAKCYPSHLFEAVVAYEDRRFFWHCGVDPVGIARAVLLFPKGGGGSTITQQLVKNVFLSNDRTFSRKAIEMLLAFILERKLSKIKILSSYLSKIYWGHGIYGVESASNFYFGKYPLLLSLGESAMLVGLIPAPELRSPFNEASRGKTYQARVLRRMVDAGFLDIEAALLTMNQRLHLHGDGKEHANRLLYKLKEELRNSGTRENWNSTFLDIWDWERETKIWETREDMGKWATRVRKKQVLQQNQLEEHITYIFAVNEW